MGPLAAPHDLDGWCEIPDNAVSLLRAGSLLVRRAVRLARYPVLDDGTPAQETVRVAMRDAVCAQVAAWVALDVDPGAGPVQPASKGGQVLSSSIGGASVQFAGASLTTAAAAAEERAASATQLVPLAALILDEAGLLAVRVRAL